MIDERHSIAPIDPQELAFWSRAAGEVTWFEPWDEVIDAQGRWFTPGQTNTCYNAVDRHVLAGRGEQAAFIHESPMTAGCRIVTYRELQAEVSRLAGALAALGVVKGDRVIIYMPMIPETAFAMLACARIGAVHSVVFGGFAPEELAKRIDDARPVLILCASCGVEPGRTIPYKPLLDAALAMADHNPRTCLVLQRDNLPSGDLTPGRDLDWVSVVADAEPVDCLPLASIDPLYILYTSGTTGVPKGIVRDQGGHMVALLWAMRHVYGAEPGEVYWAASDFGWAVGHSFTVYGPLLYGCTSIIYEGKPVGTPDAGEFWRIVSRHQVRTLFAAPTAFRAIIQANPDASLLKAAGPLPLRNLFLAGERADAATVRWLEFNLQVPVIDHWWQTETGWPIAASCASETPVETRVGSVGKPLPGYRLDVMDREGVSCANGTSGSIVLRLPLPPGCATEIWNAPGQFASGYLAAHPGYYTTGDEGMLDGEGFLYVMGREDDVLNVAGHRLSVGRIEEVIIAVPEVIECAVVGVPDALKGELPAAIVVLTDESASCGDVIAGHIREAVRSRIGGVSSLHSVMFVRRLPKTRSGKTLRKALRTLIVEGSVAPPATIDDPKVLEEIAATMHSLGWTNVRS